MSPGLSNADLCKFLALETFAELKPSSVYVAEITGDGALAPLGSFGLPVKVVSDWGSVSLANHLPMTESVKNNQVILLNREDSSVQYPALANFEGIPEKWETYLVCPILPHGLIAITLDSKPKLEKMFDSFVRTVAAIAMHHLKICQCGNQRGTGKDISVIRKKSGDLSDRQKTILLLLERGLTNPVIADQIGYSESLVRQETMAIYAHLNISGRKELLERK
jgi:DNA-binding CsgD family transcriptional regulator